MGTRWPFSDLKVRMQMEYGIKNKEFYVCVCLAAEDTRQSLQGICEEMKGKMRINHAEIKEGSPALLAKVAL